MPHLSPRRKLQVQILLVVGSISIGIALFFLPEFFADELYPLPAQYIEPIKLASAETGVPPWEVAGIIRHESNWREKAVSPGNARCLMQIIPTVGRGLFSRHLPGVTFSLEELEKPSTCIRLGTLHYAGLLGRYQGDRELALAAYNAGGGFADNYKTNRSALYQTQVGGYVKRVRNAQGIYQSVHGAEFVDAAAEPNTSNFATLFWRSTVDQLRDFLKV